MYTRIFGGDANFRSSSHLHIGSFTSLSLNFTWTSSVGTMMDLAWGERWCVCVCMCEGGGRGWGSQQKSVRSMRIFHLVSSLKLSQQLILSLVRHTLYLHPFNCVWLVLTNMWSWISLKVHSNTKTTSICERVMVYKHIAHYSGVLKRAFAIYGTGLCSAESPSRDFGSIIFGIRGSLIPVGRTPLQLLSNNHIYTTTQSQLWYWHCSYCFSSLLSA